ncbi:chemotaxis protein CheD [Reichenbachiella agarivorans]|uniref:Probable chemoreceptor glutamine deamidase CheD n=1 Tax=Reichenbachiella agarivorans TaxID=2979464 RepID=A0ABY6CNH6_9BACT|nr:chemotaxis protein CheD [Reichenbachiella agarivorans]UXP32072.1 chemotaxis protein CheD [Reichenbachiella agarivorans]
MSKVETIATHFLYPSNLFVGTTHTEVTTVLGSCISVCLYDQVKKIGGINHYMLPFWNGQGLASVKFGNIAIERLIKEMYRKNCKPENMIAKIFGGANQVDFTARIGDRNAEVARDMLKEYGIRLVAHNTGGQRGRKIIFDTVSGVVRMKFVGKAKQTGGE